MVKNILLSLIFIGWSNVWVQGTISSIVDSTGCAQTLTVQGLAIDCTMQRCEINCVSGNKTFVADCKDGTKWNNIPWCAKVTAVNQHYLNNGKDNEQEEDGKGKSDKAEAKQDKRKDKIIQLKDRKGPCEISLSISPIGTILKADDCTKALWIPTGVSSCSGKKCKVFCDGQKTEQNVSCINGDWTPSIPICIITLDKSISSELHKAVLERAMAEAPLKSALDNILGHSAGKTTTVKIRHEKEIKSGEIKGEISALPDEQKTFANVTNLEQLEKSIPHWLNDNFQKQIAKSKKKSKKKK